MYGSMVSRPMPVKIQGPPPWETPGAVTIPAMRGMDGTIQTQTSKTEATRASLEERNDMILEYLPLVTFVASRIASRLPKHIEINDLISSGIIGLIDAIEKFDDTRKIKFKTYAEFRIKGAILDELRALDWVPRSTRQKASHLEKAYAKLEQKLGRPASDAEMMKFLKISAQEFNALIRDARDVALISLDELQGDGDEYSSHNLLERLADPESLSPAQILNLDQIYRIVADTIDQLPENERIVISLYYYEELVMKEIGEILSITESRVSQIHTKAILRMRGRLLKTLGAGKAATETDAANTKRVNMEMVCANLARPWPLNGGGNHENTYCR